jgi:hypothetical protein
VSTKEDPNKHILEAHTSIVDSKLTYLNYLLAGRLKIEKQLETITIAKAKALT